MTPQQILDANKDVLIQFLIDGVKYVTEQGFKGNLIPFRKKSKATDKKHDDQIAELQTDNLAIKQLLIKYGEEIKSLKLDQTNTPLI